MISPHPSTHPSTQPSIHPLIDRSVSTNHKSPNRIELFQLGQDLFNFSDFTWPLSIYLTINHLSTQPSTHRWGCLQKSQIFKENWNISIRSRFIHFLVIFTWPHPDTHPYGTYTLACTHTHVNHDQHVGIPLHVYFSIYIGGWGVGGGDNPHTHAHAHVCIHTCMHTHMHAHTCVNHDKHVYSDFQFLYMYTLACTYMHACM